jgi:TIR domain
MAARRVFVSYRRSESAAVVGRICDQLVEFLGRESVFKDVDSIAPGEDFRTVLRTSIRVCDAMLVVIGPSWSTPRSAGAQPRLFDPDDYVRAEIEQAIAEGVTLIPVLVEGASMPAAASLPPSVQPLAYRQAVQIRSDPDFHPDMERFLRSPPFELEVERASDLGGSIRPKRPPVRRSWIAAGVAIVAAVVVAVVLVNALRSEPGTATRSGAVGDETNPTGGTTNDGAAGAGDGSVEPAGPLQPLEPTDIAVPVGVIEVEADSTLAAQGRFSYEATNLVDLDLETAWTEGDDGLGEGLRLTFRFDTPMPVERIELWPGWQSSAPCRFDKNARPNAMTAEATPQEGEPVSVAGEQVDPADPRSRFEFLLPSDLYSEVTLVIDEVAVGTSCENGPFEDTAISEVRFFASACVVGFAEEDDELVPGVDLPKTC